MGYIFFKLLSCLKLYKFKQPMILQSRNISMKQIWVLTINGWGIYELWERRFISCL